MVVTRGWRAEGLRMMFLNLQIFHKKQVSHRDLMHSTMNIEQYIIIEYNTDILATTAAAK